ncbi:beta-1,4-N-acetylgalactosaminyltransferase 3 [Trachinotus anak]|uniref:beta-1,4-N-acetylgalactosaminyltransferase 3 n=1 Tax=Trachinotus anak TaxID=443729 RepID=UPI0039F1EC12
MVGTGTGDLQGAGGAHPPQVAEGGGRPCSRWLRSPLGDKAGPPTDEQTGMSFCLRAGIIFVFLPFKKLWRNGKFLMFGAILLLGAVAVYYQMVSAKTRASNPGMNPDTDGRSWMKTRADEGDRNDHQPNYVEDSAAWATRYTPQTWKPEYKGQANLHAFDDWCGSSIAELHKNPHYPLYPHSRTTVKTLAVSPHWTNYGLRIFGYLHPYTNGEFVFAVSSADNSELWLSTDESPRNLQLLAWVGMTGREWSAPGEFEKYASQTSRPVRLSAERRYFFEVIHKQNYKGTDHVEVAWQLLDQDLKFMAIESKHISLYVNESGLLMHDVAHIPQTAASHQHTPTKQQSPAADMLREDPRDAFYKVPLINSKFLQGILPDCSYKPSYTIKDFPLARYQGLQFIHMSYIYPNDYTRLTHMELENSCFYPKDPFYMKMFGFSRYMRLDHPDIREKGNIDFWFQGRKSAIDEEDQFANEAYQRHMEGRSNQMDNALFPDYADDYDDNAQKRRRKLLSLLKQVSKRHLQPNETEFKLEGPAKKVTQVQKPKQKRPTKRQKVQSIKTTVTQRQTNPLIPVKESREQLKANDQPVPPVEQLSYKQQDLDHSIQRAKRRDEMDKEWSDTKGEEEQVWKEHKVRKVAESRRDTREAERDYPLGPGGYFEVADDEAQAPAPASDTGLKWRQTFQINHMDFQEQRSDSIDLHCNVSGNLLLHSSDVLPIVKGFMGKLNEKHHGQFTLEHVVNIVKRVDKAKGSRYLLELEVKDVNGKLLRLSQYIYSLNLHDTPSSGDFTSEHPKPELLLCNPVGLRWNPAATVHFVVPVKNQARWVQQLITDMEELFRETGDTNFNLIIVDYSSTDMDVKKTLEKSSLSRYQYVKMSGNFQRSAGLQAGVDLINDDHSIVFLCDLHIHFPPFIIDSVRKHCVEGYMVFAPVVMRLDCGATPSDGKGYWEVNGFGLLGIYKSDLNAVGGMNTKEYTDRWGGEDWELLDRILKAGLEVDRIYLRNFYHHFHSKRGMWNDPAGHR